MSEYIPQKNTLERHNIKNNWLPEHDEKTPSTDNYEDVKPKKGEIILDAGCGEGFFTYIIAKKCKICIGIDWKLNKNSSFVMSNQPNLVYIKGDVRKLPFGSCRFDKVLLSSVLQMVDSDKTLLMECYRVLKKGGVIILSVPTKYIYVKKLNKLRNELKKKFGSLGKGFYEPNEVIGLLQECGFRVVEIDYAPKRWGSLIYEVWLYFCYRTGLPLFHRYYFPLLYPLAYFDKFDNKQKGNVVVIKAVKT